MAQPACRRSRAEIGRRRVGVIGVQPAHPAITAPVTAAATGRAKAAIHQAVKQFEDCGVLEPLSESKRNRSWEAVGLLELLEGLESGTAPGTILTGTDGRLGKERSQKL